MLSDLKPHPEGGRFAERFRSTLEVTHPKLKRDRASATLIHFHLAAGEFSAWHRVASEEIWLHAEGDGLELLQWDGHGPVTRQQIGPISQKGTTTWAVVPADTWQAARPLGQGELVHCVVAPGFDFADFELMRDKACRWSEALEKIDPTSLTYL